MTVKQLIEALQAIEDQSLLVLVDDPFGSETWKLDSEAIRKSSEGYVLIQVGDRFDAEDEDNDDDPDAFVTWLAGRS